MVLNSKTSVLYKDTWTVKTITVEFIHLSKNNQIIWDKIQLILQLMFKLNRSDNYKSTNLLFTPLPRPLTATQNSPQVTNYILPSKS